MSKNQIRRNRLFQASIVVILILVLTPKASSGVHPMTYLDKVVHFALFLTVSINGCYKYQNCERRTEAIIWIIFFGLITEVIQQFIPGRDMDIYDGIANTLGVISGYYIYKMNQVKLDKVILKFGA
uniref:VanZ family protein n=1 Tax=Gelidibacter sp. TaxID=2018083 RepID=UPI00404A55D5